MSSAISFTVEGADGASSARCGLLETPHGSIATPVFAPVGTQATVKTMTPNELKSLGTQMILSNTYHLYLRPGAERVQRMGGLHRFMAWDGPILTDSGGFQVFSLAHRRSIDDDGVTFRSHIDGSEHRFTPEMVVRTQEQLGADIIMCLDECADATDRDYMDHALRRTHLWAERCRQAQQRADQALFGIVQGGIFPDLRRHSAQILTSLDFPGYAIGGLSVGETKDKMYSALEATVPELPEDRPRYLMGVGTPEDILEAVQRGVDLFDCVFPTRVARNGGLLTRRGRINIRNSRYADEMGPIETDCTCYACQDFSLAYLRHLFKAGEILGPRLATIHNVHFMLRLMRDVRSAIESERFLEFKSEFLSRYEIANQQARLDGYGSQRERRSRSA
jgi:queuine tRNA-ribosyltransferase